MKPSALNELPATALSAMAAKGECTAVEIAEACLFVAELVEHAQHIRGKAERGESGAGDQFRPPHAHHGGGDRKAFDVKESRMQVDDPQVLAEVSAAFQRYQDAIIENDVAVLNELFRDDPRTIRYGIGENLYGHAAIAGYRSARNPASLARVETKRVVTAYGSDYATTNIEFTRQGKIGRQSQAWVRMPEGWRIVAAHVSYLES